jgi:hypothetical protein
MAEENSERRDFSQILASEMAEKIGPSVRNERKILFKQGAELFFSAAELFATSSRIIL